MKYQLFLFSIMLSLSSAKGAEPHRWYAAKIKNSAEGTTESILLSEKSKTITLSNAWKCMVGSVNGSGGRETVCKKHAEEASFSVQCDSNRPNDHTQIRFKSEGIYDFIEVGCKSK